MTSQEILTKLENYFQQRPDVWMAIVYGSVVTERFKDSSDVDVAVYSDRALDADTKLDLIQELFIVTERAIDLVDLRDIHVPLSQEILTKGRFLKTNSLERKEQLVNSPSSGSSKHGHF